MGHIKDKNRTMLDKEEKLMETNNQNEEQFCKHIQEMNTINDYQEQERLKRRQEEPENY